MDKITSTSINGVRSQVARERVRVFHEQFGRAHLFFAQHAAFPLALTPDLLYRLWANFQRTAEGKKLSLPWIAVADVLLSPLCEEVSHELYEMDVAVRAELLAGLQANPAFAEGYRTGYAASEAMGDDGPVALTDDEFTERSNQVIPDMLTPLAHKLWRRGYIFGWAMSWCEAVG